MFTEPIQIGAADVRRLLSAASGDAALLYIYIHSGNPATKAMEDLHLTESRYGCIL